MRVGIVPEQELHLVSTAPGLVAIFKFLLFPIMFDVTVLSISTSFSLFLPAQCIKIIVPRKQQ